jgi:hypothetical protein
MATALANDAIGAAQAFIKPVTQTVKSYAASPAGMSESGAESANPPQFGSDRIVDIIRREQHNQMMQARTKGSQKQYQKKGNPAPHGSGGDWEREGEGAGGRRCRKEGVERGEEERSGGCNLCVCIGYCDAYQCAVRLHTSEG